jgi:hypothetical protein
METPQEFAAHWAADADELAQLKAAIAVRDTAQREAGLVSLSRPIPMILHCPDCLARHVDAGEFATKPHHTHACQSCGLVWRPAIVNTVGVQFLPGFKDDVEP